MKDFNVTIYETKAVTFAVEAEDDIEAARLVEADINKYPVISEEVVDWNVDFAEELVWNYSFLNILKSTDIHEQVNTLVV